MRFIFTLVTTAIALAVAAWLFDGIRFPGEKDWQDKVLPLLIVSLFLGGLNAIVKPLLTLLSIPLIIITLGLFLVVINAAMLLLTSELAEALDISFRVNGFWTAVGGAIVITITTWLVDRVVGEEKDRRRA